MVRRFSRSFGVRPPARTSIWLGWNIAATTLTGSSKQVIASLNAGGLALRPFTIVRSRIDVRYESDQAAVSEKPTGAVGFGVFNDTAVALGPTGVPGPFSTTEGDWFIYQPLMIHFQFLSSISFDANASQHYTIDSKAMRKVGQDDDIAMVTEMNTASGAVIASVGRILVKLH